MTLSKFIIKNLSRNQTRVLLLIIVVAFVTGSILVANFLLNHLNNPNEIPRSMLLAAIIAGSIGTATLAMIDVYENIPNIATLKVIGWPGQKIVSMLIAESLTIGFIAAILGIAIGAISLNLAFNIQYFELKTLMLESPLILFRAVITAFGISTLGMMPAALKAAKINAIEILQNE